MTVTGPITSVIGIDTGKTTGIAFLDYAGVTLVGRTFLQVEYESAQLVLEAMLSKYYRNAETVKYRFAGIEEFVTGNSAGTKGDPANIARQKVFEISQQLQLWGYHVKARKAADVKSWAKDNKLLHLGIGGKDCLFAPNGDMNHAADAARHALFAAVHDAHKPNPLR